MYSISEQYKNHLDSDTSFIARYKIVVDEKEYLSNVIKSFPKIVHKNSKFIGGFSAKTCSFEMFNINNDIDFENKEMKIFKGIVIDGEIEYIPQGIFIPKAKDITTDISTKNVKFDNVQDKSQLFDETYKSTLNWVENHTGLEIVQEICTNLNIELDSDNFNWATYKFKQPNFVENITYREVVSRLAEIGGSIAFITREGKLSIKEPTLINHEIKRQRYTKLTKEKEFGKINVVVLGKEGIDDDIVYPDERPENRVDWKILDNPYVDLNRKEMIEEVSKYIIGKSIIPFSLEGFIDGYYLDVNDIVSITDKNGEIFNATILNYETTGRIKSKVEAEVQNQEKTNYSLAGSNKQSVNEVKLQVDHVNQRVESLASNVGQYDSRISRVEQTADEISQKVDNMIDPVRMESGTTYVKISEAVEGPLLKLSISNMQYVYPSNKTFPSTNTFPKGNVLIIDKERNLTEEAKRFYMPYRNLYYYNEETYDELVIERVQIEDEETEEITEKHTVSIIHRCKLTDDLEVVPLTQPTIETFDDIDVQLFKGDNYIYMESFQKDVVKYDVTYAVQSELEDVFATKVELNTSITQTKKEISLEVDQAVEDGTKTETLISKINLTPGQIKLEGTVTANENFKILADGSIVAKNGNFTGNIYLEDGNKVIGGDGLLSNLQYQSIGNINGWSIIGFSFQLAFDEKQGIYPGYFNFYYEDAIISSMIPDNFTVVEAYLTLFTTPIYNQFQDSNSNPDYWTTKIGTPKKLRLYKTDSIVTRSFYYVQEGDASGYNGNYNPTLTEIKNAFGVEEYTPKGSEPGDVDTITSINLKDYIEKGKLNNFLVRTNVTKKEKPTNTALSAENTGMIKMTLNVFGYMSLTNE